MPKKTEATEEALQEKQNDTVTVSAAEFNEMKEQLKLLSKFMT